MRALVTGGGGFVGIHLVERLVEEEWAVDVLDRRDDPTMSGRRPAVRYFAVALPSPSLARILQDGQYNVVFHLGGSASVACSIDDPRGDLQDNAVATLDLLECVRSVSPETKVVYTSSAAVYGNPVRLPISEDDPAGPVSPYGVSKLAAENYVKLYARLHGLRTLILRPFSIYGPGLRRQVVFDLILKLLTQPQELTVWGSGQETRDFIHVRDVASAILTATHQGAFRGESLNVGSGAETAVRHLVELIADAMDCRPRVHYLGRGRPGDPVRWCADISQLSRLGFEPDVPLAQGIGEVFRWARAEAKRGNITLSCSALSEAGL